MLQVFQHQNSGEVLVEELPGPLCPPGGILVRVYNSLISAGTERSSVAKAEKSLIARARSQKDDVKTVLDSLRKDGIVATYRKVMNALNAYRPLGYSTAGEVVQSNTPQFNVGDRVACAGSAYAYHAELNAVPANLAAPIPEGVSFEDAAYTTLGAIAMQGVRQADLRLGENVAVIGLGLLGQITVQLLKASGCRVIGLDIDPDSLELAEKLGADATAISSPDAVQRVLGFSRGKGVDAVLITAATSSNEPLEIALKMARRKAKVVVVGAVGMNVPRSPFYEKEQELLISCSYGPGRYDPNYEEHGQDYPYEYVRWTEQRNMQAFLDLIASGAINMQMLTTHRIAINDAAGAYDLIMGRGKEPYLGIVLEYPERRETMSIAVAPQRKGAVHAGKIGMGFVGAGAFAQTHLLPHMRNESIDFTMLAGATPVRVRSVAENFGFREFTTDFKQLVNNKDIKLVACATRHDTHAEYVTAALAAGKDVFVEKPLALTSEELRQVDATYQKSGGRLLVGFNRRFSPPLVKMKEFFSGRQEPLAMSYRVNAGAIPATHWTQDPAQGGRIIGEACHFIDTMAFLADADPVGVHAVSVHSAAANLHLQDVVSISVQFGDGSIGTVHYFANGAKGLGKEYLEAHGEGRSAIMDNFKTLNLLWGTKRNDLSFDGGKGHAQEIAAMIDALKQGGEFPIGYQTLHSVTESTFAAVESLASGNAVSVG